MKLATKLFKLGRQLKKEEERKIILYKLSFGQNPFFLDRKIELIDKTKIPLRFWLVEMVQKKYGITQKEALILFSLSKKNYLEIKKKIGKKEIESFLSNFEKELNGFLEKLI